MNEGIESWREKIDRKWKNSRLTLIIFARVVGVRRNFQKFQVDTYIPNEIDRMTSKANKIIQLYIHFELIMEKKDFQRIIKIWFQATFFYWSLRSGSWHASKNMQTIYNSNVELIHFDNCCHVIRELVSRPKFEK